MSDEQRNKFVLYFSIALVIIFAILVFRALSRGTTTVEDVLEPNETFTESFFD